jgi:prolyl-tRNA synthetase
MRQSQLFTKTRKDAPKDEVAKNAQLLIRGGYIHKEMAGVYSFLPLGLRVLNKINNIVREEMNAVGGQELLMSVLQSKELWEKTGRWSDAVVDNWFKTELKNGAEVGLGFTQEEPITNIMRDYINSYNDLPKLAYHIQWKYRNEERAKSGIMRGREFLMKDLYSFASSQEEHERLYESIAAAYMKIFARVGIGERTYRTFASGGVFSKYSHEFQCLSDIGEDTIHVSAAKKLAVNKEVMNAEVLADLGVSKSELEEKKSIEVGNIFSLGTRFSDALGLKFKEKDGSEKAPIMGCYGLGCSRLMGALVEVFADEKGIVWPKEVAPFAVHLVSLAGSSTEVGKEADRMYELLQEQGIDVLYDDRDARAGEKFADSDLLGIPVRLVVSEKTIAQAAVEMSERNNGSSSMVPENELVERLKKS